MWVLGLGIDMRLGWIGMHDGIGRSDWSASLLNEWGFKIWVSWQVGQVVGGFDGFDS